MAHSVSLILHSKGRSMQKMKLRLFFDLSSHGHISFLQWAGVELLDANVDCFYAKGETSPKPETPCEITVTVNVPETRVAMIRNVFKHQIVEE